MEGNICAAHKKIACGMFLETWVGSLGWEDPLEMGKAILEKEMATHSSILAWRIP